MEGHHPPNQHSKCACQFQGQKGHCMWVHVLMELMPGLQFPTAVVTMVTYGELHLRSSRVPICLCNLSTCSMEIPAKTVVGQVAPANQVPLVGLPTRTSEESNDKPLKGWVLEALDLQGLKEWPKPEKNWGNCCSNGNTCLHAVTWTWAKLL